MPVWREEWIDGTVKHYEWEMRDDMDKKASVLYEMLVSEGEFGVHLQAAIEVVKEYRRARTKFKPMHSSHEGYAVILEELDEMWDAIKANDIPHAREECLQVAAMCLAFLLEVLE